MRMKHKSNATMKQKTRKVANINARIVKKLQETDQQARNFQTLCMVCSKVFDALGLENSDTLVDMTKRILAGENPSDSEIESLTLLLIAEVNVAQHGEVAPGLTSPPEEVE